MHPAHPSAPPGPESFSGQGMCLEFQVMDAKAEYDRVVREGAQLTLSLQDEPFGQRRFGLFDPAGVWIDVVEQIEPVAGWWDKYLVANTEAQQQHAERQAGLSIRCYGRGCSMRKVVLKMHVSLDDYMRAASGDVMDWVFRTYDDELKAWEVDLLWQAGTQCHGSQTGCSRRYSAALCNAADPDR